MLFMVTNRLFTNGKYGDEERPNKEFEYQYSYNNKARGHDKFEKTGKNGFEKALLSELERLKREDNISTPKVGIYLHGYNNDYQDSIDEIFDLEASFTKIQPALHPIIVGFSWPSSGKLPYYLSDRDEVRDSIGAFTRFLLEVNDLVTRNQKNCFSTTFCIAHSMGNYLLRKGLEYLSDELGSPTGRLLFDETILLAPDIASNSIEIDGKGRHIAHFSRRTHVYYSKHDRALKTSSVKRFGANRLGRHGANDYANLPQNVVVVDAKNYANAESIAGTKDRAGEQVSVHSSHRYQERILTDIAKVISSIDRDQIEGRKPYEVDGIPMQNHYRLA